MAAGSVDRADVIWRPTPEMEANSAFSHYRRWLAADRGLDFPGYAEMHRWSVTELESFWRTIWDHFELAGSPEPSRMHDGLAMPGTRWLPGVRLNWAQHMLRHGADDDDAVVCVSETGSSPTSWLELRSQVAAASERLREWGLGPGDAVVAYAGNRPEVLVMLLACASIGALWSACSPEFGSASVLARFGQLMPRVLLAQDGYVFAGREHSRAGEVEQLARGLPSVEHVVWLGALPEPAAMPQTLPGVVTWSGFSDMDAPATPRFDAVDASHPLWALFSSGTTGPPKGIVHSHGGIVLEHHKSTALHNDVRAGDRFMFVASTSWMVWNVLISGLMRGATVVMLDASPVHPDAGRLWQIAAEQRISVLGVGAGYVQSCQKAGLRPREANDLSSLRVVSVTGSPLSAESARWVIDSLGDVWLLSASGGTDVCGSFVSGVPTLPVRAGRIQAANLGVDALALDDRGRPVVGAQGELAIGAPMPSMPLGLLGDATGERYRATYFEAFPGYWRHGDHVSFDADGSCVITGRSDSSLNKRGVRMGPAEIYDAVEILPSVREALVVGAELPDGEYYMPLFLVPAQGADPEQVGRDAVAAIRRSLSPRHVPDAVIVVPAIPHTRTGKKLEVPVKRLLQGAAVADVVDLASVDDESAVAFFAAFARDFQAGRGA